MQLEISSEYKLALQIYQQAIDTSKSIESTLLTPLQTHQMHSGSARMLYQTGDVQAGKSTGV